MPEVDSLAELNELVDQWDLHNGRRRIGSRPGTLPAGYQIPATAPLPVQQAIRWALGQLGTPYQWSGTCTDPHGDAPMGRYDCSSLMQRAYGVAGHELTRTTYTQVNEGTPVPVNAIQAGDLVFSRGSATVPEHVVMAIGDGLAVHAPKPGQVVKSPRSPNSMPSPYGESSTEGRGCSTFDTPSYGQGGQGEERGDRKSVV